jgi:DNA invertase Pin-like site-specific DNA recombinase
LRSSSDLSFKERQREGIALAKKADVYRRRKQSLTPEQVIELLNRVSSGEKKSARARAFGISPEAL